MRRGNFIHGLTRTNTDSLRKGELNPRICANGREFLIGEVLG